MSLFFIEIKNQLELFMIDYRENNKWKVYVHIVPKEISGHEWDKYYIGITSQEPHQRWGSVGNGYSQ